MIVWGGRSDCIGVVMGVMERERREDTLLLLQSTDTPLQERTYSAKIFQIF